MFWRKKSLKPRALTDLTQKKSSTGLGAFVDLNNDLGVMMESFSSQELEPKLLMPYLYARRIANCGMYAQGVIEEETVEYVEDLFFKAMANVGSKLTKKDQIIFQEASFDTAVDLIQAYITGATKDALKMMVFAAKKEICVRDALVSGLSKRFDNEELSEALEPVVLSDLILKAEYCIGFFSTGCWQLDDDFDSTAKNVIKYFNSLGFTMTAGRGPQGSPRFANTDVENARLKDVVRRQESSPYGGFVNLMRDLDDFYRNHSRQASKIHNMAYAHANRLAVAGAFFQGLAPFSDYKQAALQDDLSQKLFDALDWQYRQAKEQGEEITESYVPQCSSMSLGIIELLARQKKSFIDQAEAMGMPVKQLDSSPDDPAFMSTEDCHKLAMMFWKDLKDNG